MRELLIILTFLSSLNSFSQEIKFSEIVNLESYTEKFISIDTLEIKNWKNLNEKKKLKVRKYISETNNRIKNDTSQVSQILYYGLPETIIIESDEINKTVETKTQSKNYFYRILDYPTRQKTYELISFKRNTGIKEFKIYFTHTKRFATLKVDTKFSEIYINPQIDIELIEFEEGTLGTELDENGIPKPAKHKLIKKEDEIIIDHKYARKKHSL